jgi:hypothetical protein
MTWRQGVVRSAAAGIVAALSLLAGGCGALSGLGVPSFREIVGFGPTGDPSVAIRPTESRWLLIKNPRFGDVASEPEYIWVEEDKVPTTMKSLFLGKSVLIAPPEVVARYGAPPGGGRISPRQGGPYQVENVGPSAAVAAAPSPSRLDAGPAAPAPARGYVVHVDAGRVVIDLTGKDGIRVGSVVSVRRDRIPIVHPITGELLGELDEEVAAGRVTEVRDKFSVVEIQNMAAGAQVQVKDRAIVR